MPCALLHALAEHTGVPSRPLRVLPRVGVARGTCVAALRARCAVLPLPVSILPLELV